jgi:hypothetical protein
MLNLLRYLFVLLAIIVPVAAAQAADPLPSWNDGPTKKAIEAFVKKVTDKGGPDYVPPADRIAVFDNDGNLWAEKPVYFQLLFAIDRVKALAPEHPEWNDQQPFKAAIEGNMTALAASGKKGLLEILAASHTGMSSAEFQRIASDWLAAAKHPRVTMDSAPISSLAAVSNSCAISRSRSMVFRPRRWSAQASRPNTRLSTANRRSCACRK